jgi:hypothetical protein
VMVKLLQLRPAVPGPGHSMSRMGGANNAPDSLRVVQNRCVYAVCAGEETQPVWQRTPTGNTSPRILPKSFFAAIHPAAVVASMPKNAKARSCMAERLLRII